MNPVLTVGYITSPQDIMIVLVIALIVFGPKKLPEIGKQIGTALRELNRMRGDVQRAFDLDEYTRFDTTPQYHSTPYGATYPSTMPDQLEPVVVDHDMHHIGSVETPAEVTAAPAIAPPGPLALRSHTQTDEMAAGGGAAHKE